jgi:ribosomal protein L23
MIIQKPVYSEKSRLVYQKNKVCVFYVSPQANKFQIREDFEKIFKVKVKKIRTSRQKPVKQKTSFRHKFPGKSYTKLLKKAFIELMPNHELPLLTEKQQTPKIF